jgi:tryptophan-rich sensory protein
MNLDLVLTFVLCLAVSFLLPLLFGVSYKAYEQDWYKQLKRPRIALPDLVFIVIFPLFYLLEAIGLYQLVTHENRTPMLYFGLLYLLSAALSGVWSRLFFKYRRCDLSLWAFFLELPVGWVFLYLLYQEDHAAWLYFLPRVLWGLYAIVANVDYYRLNRAFWDRVKAER